MDEKVIEVVMVVTFCIDRAMAWNFGTMRDMMSGLMAKVVVAQMLDRSGVLCVATSRASSRVVAKRAELDS